MTTTHTTRLDQCPPGLVLVAAHGEIPGGLAWKYRSGIVDDLYGWWSIESTEINDFEGVPMTPIPTETAAASTDPRISAYTKEN
jgi:hypothetical protein